MGLKQVSINGIAGCPLLRGFECIEDTIWTFKIVRYITGVCGEAYLLSGVPLYIGSGSILKVRGPKVLSAREIFMPRPLINGKLVREAWRSWEATKNNRQKQYMAGRAAMKLTVLTQN